MIQMSNKTKLEFSPIFFLLEESYNLQNFYFNANERTNCFTLIWVFIREWAVWLWVVRHSNEYTIKYFAEGEFKQRVLSNHLFFFSGFRKNYTHRSCATQNTIFHWDVRNVKMHSETKSILFIIILCVQRDSFRRSQFLSAFVSDLSI